MIQALKIRVTSPFFGMVVTAFIVLNWKVFFVLVSSDSTTLEKFEYYDSNVIYWRPLALGILAALVSPYLKLFGAWISRWPRQTYANWMSDEGIAQEAYTDTAKHAYEVKRKRDMSDMEDILSEAELSDRISNLRDARAREELSSRLGAIKASNSKVLDFEALTKTLDTVPKSHKLVLYTLSQYPNQVATIESNAEYVHIKGDGISHLFRSSNHPEVSMAVYNLLNKDFIVHRGLLNHALSPLGSAAASLISRDEKLKSYLEVARPPAR